jgi:methylated-DNA-[protein]-cysteine S-methyltransferase
MSLDFRIAECPLGHFAVIISPRGLRRVYLPGRSRAKLRQCIRRDHPEARERQDLQPDLISALQRYFAGEPVGFDVPLDAGGAGAFEKQVWQACRKIPYGRTTTYGELAKRVGRPGAARAVGAAMAHNRFPIIVPCHRVLRSDGGLGGFSGPDGVSLKRRLLDLEEATATA